MVIRPIGHTPPPPDIIEVMAICVCGEGLVDLVPVSPGSLNNHVPALGGGPYNVAVTASRLGADVIFQSRLSTDGFGNELVKHLETEGVDTTYVQRGPEPTILAVTTIHDDRSATYTFYTDGTATPLVEPKLIDANIACFGTLSLALEPGASRYAELLKQFAANDTLVALDPNIRPMYATDAHREFLMGLLPYVNLLKLSDEEVEFLGEEALTKVPAAVITRGGDGLTLLADGNRIDVPAVNANVVDTIGAGDTIMGALLAQFDERGLTVADLTSVSPDQWREILHYAAAAAAITVSRKGAQPPTKIEVEELLAKDS